MVIFVDRIRHNTFHVLPAHNCLALLGDGGDCGTLPPLDQSLGSILQFLAQGAQLRHGLGDVMVEGKTLRLKQMRILRDHHRSLLGVDFLGTTEAFCLFSPEGLARHPARILLGDVRQVFDLTELYRPHIMQFEGINKTKIRHLSRDCKSSEQFVWRNLAYR